jgi:hypothetical protein
LAAFAATACSANAAPLLYDCDSAPGRLSVLETVQPGPSYRVSGRISANELVKHQRWAPTGSASIESADEQDRIMLQLSAPEQKAPLQVVLRTTNKGKVSTQTLGQVGLEQDLAFSVTVADGRAKVEIGTMRGEAAVDLGAGAKVGVSCTTGNFHFEDLRFGEPD